MRKVYCPCFFLFIFLSIQGYSQLSKSNFSDEDNSQLRGNGMQFVQNRGQVVDMGNNLRPDVMYVGDGGGVKVYLRRTGISYALSNMAEITREVKIELEELEKKGELSYSSKQEKEQELADKRLLKLHRIDMDFEGGNPVPNILASDLVDGYLNFYYAHCSNGITAVNVYNRIVYQNVYPNIDIVFYGGKREGVKYDIVVKPGGNPADIRLKYNGSDDFKIENGKLKIGNSISEITENLPKVFQNINGEIVDVDAQYFLEGKTLSFQFGSFNSQYSLVIDPWATYCGGSSNEYGASVTTDTSGNVLITGGTQSLGFPVTPGACQIAMNGVYDAFVVKFNSSGARHWATFYGGSTTDWGASIATDNINNVVITGETRSGDFPVSTGAFQTNHIGASGDAFVVKFNVSGTMLWATFSGGSSADFGLGIAADNSGNVLVTGRTESSNFPVSTGAFQAIYGGGISDVFVAKFNSTGVLSWATYCGGNSTWDEGYGITADAVNNIYVTGHAGILFPVTAGAFQMAHAGGVYDAFILKLDPGGNPIWSTYCGGSNEDHSKSILLDNMGNIVISGDTKSLDFPVTAGAFQTVLFSVGTSEAFVAKFSPAGMLIWGTFFGGGVNDYGMGVAVDDNDNIYFVMEQEDATSNIAVDACAWQPLFNGGSAVNPNGGVCEDQLIVKFTSSGQKLCATYVGGTGEDDMDYYGGIAAFGNSVYITGSTDGGYPVTTGAFQTASAGPSTFSGEAFLISLCNNICEGKVLGLSYTSNSTSSCAGTLVAFTPAISNSCDTSGYKFQWTFPGGNPVNSSEINPTITYVTSGSHNVKLVLTTSCKKDSVITNIVTSNIINTSGSQVICQGLLVPIHGIIQNTPGIYTQTFTAAGGCDSISAVTLAVNNTSSAAINPIACGSYTQGSQTYTISGVYTQTLANAVGCDSLLTINLTVNSNIDTTNIQNVCLGQPALIHGISRTTPGVYTQTFVAYNGCDSVSIVRLNVNNPITTNAVLNICAGQSALIHGLNQNMPGVYTQTFSAIRGCDSMSNVTLIVNHSNSGIINPSACGGYTHNSQTYSASGIYTQTLINSFGCDSILTINLTIINNINTGGNQSICQGQSTMIHGASQNIFGIYTQTFLAANGCDSISTIILTVYSPLNIQIGNDTSITTGQSIVAGTPLVINNSYSWSSGETTSNIIVQPTATTSYILTVIDSNGCITYDTIAVSVVTPCDNSVEIFVPNTFSPNGDGQNDALQLYSNGKSGIIHFVIFNRWGEKVFESSGLANTWDGIYKGRPMDSAVFSYLLKITCDTDEIIKTGNISLIR